VKWDYPWKQPCLVCYTRCDVSEVLTVEPRANPITSDVILRETTTVTAVTKRGERIFPRRLPNEPAPLKSFVPLTALETIGRGTHVAIDCEFVAVENEESVIKPDGSSVVVRPSRLTLARVSVLRGEGRRSGEPFIDDYIHTSEPVVDYLTQYSGLQAGDLDPLTTTHHLTTLKEAYVRLRALVDQGVVFIGHGLVKDFQMINIFVPPSQIVDTVDLFSEPGRRKLGLRFLARHVLNRNIQEDTHDSIEDARTALGLFDVYKQLKQTGTLKAKIEQLYDIGERSGFKG